VINTAKRVTNTVEQLKQLHTFRGCNPAQIQAMTERQGRQVNHGVEVIPNVLREDCEALPQSYPQTAGCGEKPLGLSWPQRMSSTGLSAPLQGGPTDISLTDIADLNLPFRLIAEIACG
jgi:hypothetical protein